MSIDEEILLSIVRLTAILQLGQCVFSQGLTSGQGQCPLDRPYVYCDSSPCWTSKCPSFPTAVCVDDFCGGCTARFYQDNREVTLNCFGASVVSERMPPPTAGFPQLGNDPFVSPTQQQPQTIFRCPARLQPMSCTVPPCQMAHCPQYPTAVCFNDNCGACIARFFNPVTMQEITDSCYYPQSRNLYQISYPTTSDGSNIVIGVIPTSNPGTLVLSSPDLRFFTNSYMQPNYRGPLEPAFPSTTIGPIGIGNPYNGNAVFNPPAHKCLNGQTESNVQCPMQSCFRLVCPQFPAATCSEDTCTGCSPKFSYGSTDVTNICFEKQARSSDETGIRSTVGAICPQGFYKVKCNFPPCQYGGCPGYPSARCYEDNCGSCTARYFISATEVTDLCYSRFPS